MGGGAMRGGMLQAASPWSNLGDKPDHNDLGMSYRTHRSYYKGGKVCTAMRGEAKEIKVTGIISVAPII